MMTPKTVCVSLRASSLLGQPRERLGWVADLKREFSRRLHLRSKLIFLGFNIFLIITCILQRIVLVNLVWPSTKLA